MTSPIFVCGGECALILHGVGFPDAHWHESGNNTPTAITDPVRTGTYAMQTVAEAVTYSGQLAHQLVGTATVAVLRCYLQIPAMPSIDSSVVSLAGTIASALLQVKADGTIQATVVGTSTVDGPVFPSGSWHRLEMRLNVSANPWVLDWSVDGQAQTQLTAAKAADTIQTLSLGSQAGGIGLTCNWDDVIVSETSADYPIGDGTVLGYAPNGIGTHNLSANEFLDDTSTALTAGDTDSYLRLDEPLGPTDLTDFVKQAIIGGTHYLEYLLGDELVNPNAINGVQASVLTHRVGAGTTASSKAVLWDGTTANDLAAAAAPAQAGTFISKCYALTPTGAVWTRALLNAARLRWGYATGVTDGPCLDAAVLEVDFRTDLAAPMLTAALQLVNDTTLELDSVFGVPLEPQFELIVESETETVIDTVNAPIYDVARDPAQAVEHANGSVVDLLPFRDSALVLPRSSIDPLNPYLGQTYFNTVANKIMVYTGAAWEAVTSV